MKNLILILTTLLLLSACNGSKTGIDEKKADLAKLEKQHEEISKKILTLKEEIKNSDPKAKDDKKRKSVQVTEVSPQDFKHFIDGFAVVESDRNTVVTAKTPGFVINDVKVKVGDRVSAGQLLCSVDNSSLSNNLEPLKVQYALANTAYERQKNLWEKQIGSELQFLQAKTQKEALEKQIASIQSQIANTNIVAPFGGTVEAVNFKIGDNTANPMGGIRIVDAGSLKMVSRLADVYITKVHKGDNVEITIPDLGNKTMQGKVAFASNTINAATRNFEVQISLPKTSDLKLNMQANIKINDNTLKNVFVVTENLVQTTEGKPYILVLDQVNGKYTVSKRDLTIGASYGGQVVVTGLKKGDLVITTGYSNLNVGEEVNL